VTVSRRTFLATTGGVVAVVVGACARSRGRSASTSPIAVPGAVAPPAPTLSPPTSAPSLTTTSVPLTTAAFVSTGPTTTGRVALTFHGSGSLSLAEALLAEAAAVQAPITVFAVGQWLSQNPGIGQRILDGGHELANHTWSHGDILHMSPSGVADEIRRCRDVIAAQTKVTADYFRPSQTPDGLSVPDLVLRQAADEGYPTVVGYDVDPSDYKDPGSSLVESRVRDNLHAGAIISLHLGHQGTVTAFRPIVAAIKARGLTPVLVRDLLSHP
jgi:peptidoglycan/xylan/chitin deacetylase (PgdA/CDA1 family)